MIAPHVRTKVLAGGPTVHVVTVPLGRPGSKFVAMRELVYSRPGNRQWYKPEPLPEDPTPADIMRTAAERDRDLLAELGPGDTLVVTRWELPPPEPSRR
jgi:hypothetical protein